MGVPTFTGYIGVVSLLWSDLANNLGVGDFSVAVRWDLVVGMGKRVLVPLTCLPLLGPVPMPRHKRPSLFA
jgi:hypothetical protein